MNTQDQNGSLTRPESQPKPRKEEILDVATRLFAERGYEGTSMNDVAERVGMRKASLFYHFATKDALYEAVLDRLVLGFAGALGKAYGGEGSFETRAERAADTMTTVLGEHHYAARLLLREAMDWGPVIRGKLLEHMLTVFDAGVAFVRAGQEAGEFVDGDPKQLILTSLGAHFIPFAIGNLVERFAGTDPFDPAFVEQRRVAMKCQMQALMVKRKS
jgi:TetR/AcrR family transcriptional regulator